MAVHTFAVNMDSLSGSMSHNYYLYEYDGQQEDSSALIDGSSLDISAMGQFSMGGGGGIKENKRRPSFSGMPQQSAPTDSLKNIGIYGICLAVMVIMLFVVKGIKRRK